MFLLAKSLGTKTMLGCMVSSSVELHRRRPSLAAGGLRRTWTAVCLIANDPCHGVTSRERAS